MTEPEHLDPEIEIETNPEHIHKGLALNPVGLENFGMTCYANSALQAFLGVDLFRRWLVATADYEEDYALAPGTVMALTESDEPNREVRRHQVKGIRKRPFGEFTRLLRSFAQDYESISQYHRDTINENRPFWEKVAVQWNLVKEAAIAKFGDVLPNQFTAKAEYD